MGQHSLQPLLLGAAWVLATAASATAAVTLAPPFTEHMVLQRDQPVPVWGTAAPGEQVTVEFAGQEKSATTDGKGTWRVTLDRLPASAEGRVLRVQGSGFGVQGTKDKSGQAPGVRAQGSAASLTPDTRHLTPPSSSPLTVADVVVGEVWLASGQSNMELPVKDTADAAAEMARADYPAIRMLTVAHAGTPEPAANIRGTWAVCSPTTVGAFSAVGYYFAREIHARLKVPVGIINVSWGGSPIQPWMPWETAQAVKAMRPRLDAYAAQHAQWLADKPAYEKQVRADAARQAAAQQEWVRCLVDEDFGRHKRWFDPATDMRHWRPMELPMPSVAEALNYMGSFWFRRDIELPPAWVGKKLMLNLGAIDDGDVTWVNGHEVGRTLYDVRDGWRTPRHYAVPADLVTAARVTIVMQAVNHVFTLGVQGTAKDMSLSLADDAAAAPVSLAGTWYGTTGTEVDVTAQPAAYRSPWPQHPWGDIGGFSNAMIRPLAGYGLRGFLWYQGESNATEPDVYAELFPALIRGWRAAWQRELPFYFVQLAGFCARQRDPIERGSWAELREAQRAALALPRTGMAVATDIGDAGDIHPRNKQEVGRRLALWALANDYGQKVECSGPLYDSMKLKSDRIQLRFAHAKGLRTADGKRLAGFAVAGADKVFHWAEAQVDGKSVTVWSDQVPKPEAVRYGWAFTPIGNLVNGDGLPAAPFRTDTWGATEVRSAP